MIAPRSPFLIFAATLALLPMVQAGPVLREPGAIYLQDVVPKPVKLNVPDAAPIYFDLGMSRYLGMLKKGQFVELQAVTDYAYRVKGQAQQGQVAGWVEPKYLDALKADFLDNLKKSAARLEEVNALIARKEVAINMTPEEVIASLGKASKLISRLDAAGNHDVWEYIKYDLEPQQTTGRDQYGNIFTSTIYVKVPVGKLSVIFDNHLVTAIEQSEGSLAKSAQVKIVNAPFVLY